MITKENKEKAIAKTARSQKDVGSPEVQVSILTERIKEVTQHVKTHKLVADLCKWLAVANAS